MLKVFHILTQLGIILTSLAFAFVHIFISSIVAFPAGLFSVPNSFSEQIVGKILILLSVIIVGTSFVFLNRKNKTKPFLILLVSAVLMKIDFAIIEGFDNEQTLFTILYIIAIIAFFYLEKYISKKLKKESATG